MWKYAPIAHTLLLCFLAAVVLTSAIEQEIRGSDGKLEGISENESSAEQRRDCMETARYREWNSNQLIIYETNITVFDLAITSTSVPFFEIRNDSSLHTLIPLVTYVNNIGNATFQIPPNQEVYYIWYYVHEAYLESFRSMSFFSRIIYGNPYWDMNRVTYSSIRFPTGFNWSSEETVEFEDYWIPYDTMFLRNPLGSPYFNGYYYIFFEIRVFDADTRNNSPFDYGYFEPELYGIVSFSGFSDPCGEPHRVIRGGPNYPANPIDK